MSLYDSGVDRKPPLPQQYIHNTPANNEYNEYECQEATNEVVIISIIPATDGCINEIGCIILSSSLQEKESFSFNFFVDGVSFPSQSDYIYNSLDNRIWIINNEYDTLQIINNSFKSINKNIPQPQTIINAAQIFNDYKVEQNSNFSIHTNARMGCTHIYSTLQRIALNQLLSPITSVDFINNVIPRQTMQSVMEATTDYNQINQVVIQEVDNNNNNVEDNILNDIISGQQQAPPPPGTTTLTITDTVDTNTNINNNNNQYEPQPVVEAQERESINNDDTLIPVIPDANINNNNERNGFHSDEAAATATTGAAAAEPEEAECVADDKIEKMEEIVQVVEDKVLVVEEKPIAVVEEKDSRSISPIINNMNNNNQQAQAQPQQQQQPPPPHQPQMDNKPIIKSSWVTRFKTSTSQSPKRRALGVVDHVSDKITFRGGKYGSSCKSVDGIRNSITDAINLKRIIWVSYNGHMKPFIPRAIRPQSWDHRAKQKESFFAIQHKSKSQNQQRFYLKNVIEVRDKQWRISNDDLQQLKKRNNNNNYNYMHNNNNNNQMQNNNTQRYKNQRTRAYNTNNQNVDK